MQRGKLNRARFQLYRSQILQENMRWEALAEIYTKHSVLQLSNLNLFCVVLLLSNLKMSVKEVCQNVANVYQKLLDSSEMLLNVARVC